MNEADHGPGEDRAKQRWWRRPRWIVTAAVVGVLLVGGGVVLAVAWSGRGAEEASIEETVEGLHRGQDGGVGLLRPATGVYVYEGSGTEHLSVLDTSQEWGPRLPASVERDATGCWTFKIRYSTHHEQSTTYCPRDDVLEEAGGSTFQSFDFVVTTIDDLTEFVCTPPGETIRVNAERGAKWRQSCDGRSEQRGTHVTSAGTNTFVAVETVEIAGEKVRAYHYRAQRTLTGDQTGEDNVETWYRVRDALPLRSTRDAHVDSPSPIGTVTYTEHGSYTLTSLEPRR